jgi:hypothetical protein
VLTEKVTPNSIAEKVSKLPAHVLPQVDGFVEYLAHKYTPRKRKSKINRNLHPAFGLWAKKLEGISTEDYVAELRRNVMRRFDDRSSP